MNTLSYNNNFLRSSIFIGKPFVDLRPGDGFRPCYFDVPARLRADFLWAGVGILVVSERIKSLLSICVAMGLPFTNRA